MELNSSDLLRYIIDITPDEKYTEKTNKLLYKIYENISHLQEAQDRLVDAYNQGLEVNTPEQRNNFRESLRIIEQACQSMHITAREKLRI